MGRLTPVGHAGELPASQGRLVHRPMHDRPRTRSSALPQSRTLSSGEEVRQDALAAADVTHQHGTAVTDLGTSGTRQCESAQLLRKMPSQATDLVFVSDAGPWGYWLSR